jgi:hypothetical protein
MSSPRFSRTLQLSPAVFIAASAALAGSIALRAEQGPPQGGGAKPLIPITASTIAREPAAHIGENVSMTSR